jgi:hypothetical protein
MNVRDDVTVSHGPCQYEVGYTKAPNPDEVIAKIGTHKTSDSGGLANKTRRRRGAIIAECSQSVANDSESWPGRKDNRWRVPSSGGVG